MPLIPALRRPRQTVLSSRVARSTERVPGQPGLHREPLSRKTKQNKQKPFDHHVRVIHIYAAEGVEQEGIIVNEISQTQEGKHCKFSLIEIRLKQLK